MAIVEKAMPLGGPKTTIDFYGQANGRSGSNPSSTFGAINLTFEGFKKAIVTCTSSIPAGSSAWIKVDDKVVKSFGSVRNETYEIDLTNASSFSCGVTSNNDSWCTSSWTVKLTN